MRNQPPAPIIANKDLNLIDGYQPRHIAKLCHCFCTEFLAPLTAPTAIFALCQQGGMNPANYLPTCLTPYFPGANMPMGMIGPKVIKAVVGCFGEDDATHIHNKLAKWQYNVPIKIIKEEMIGGNFNYGARLTQENRNSHYYMLDFLLAKKIKPNNPQFHMCSPVEFLAVEIYGSLSPADRHQASLLLTEKRTTPGTVFRFINEGINVIGIIAAGAATAVTAPYLFPASIPAATLLNTLIQAFIGWLAGRFTPAILNSLKNLAEPISEYFCNMIKNALPGNEYQRLRQQTRNELNAGIDSVESADIEKVFR